MGCYDTPEREPSDDESDDANCKFVPFSCDVGCQTPKEWLSCQASQEAKEAEPQRAPKRNGASGTCANSNI